MQNRENREKEIHTRGKRQRKGGRENVFVKIIKCMINNLMNKYFCLAFKTFCSYFSKNLLVLQKQKYIFRFAKF